MRFRFAFALCAAGALALAPLAAKAPPSPEQRIERLEKQLRQVQRQVFPKGQPADTAGFSDEPAATQTSVSTLNSRLDAIEQQMTGLVRATEENGNRLSVIEADFARLKTDQDRRLRALETGGSTAEGGDSGGPAEAVDQPPPAPQPKIESGPPPKPQPKVETADGAGSPADPAEAAYDAGYQLWNTKKYDQAITSLKAMAEKYPAHRRTSWAYNLAGRAMLDKGQPRAAAEALLANYRRDPKGERAPDSLFYLGQSLLKLGQPSQACKAYAELEDVYGSTMRLALRQMLPEAKSEAKCG